MKRSSLYGRPLRPRKKEKENAFLDSQGARRDETEPKVRKNTEDQRIPAINDFLKEERTWKRKSFVIAGKSSVFLLSLDFVSVPLWSYLSFLSPPLDRHSARARRPDRELRKQESNERRLRPQGPSCSLLSFVSSSRARREGTPSRRREREMRSGDRRLVSLGP